MVDKWLSLRSLSCLPTPRLHTATHLQKALLWSRAGLRAPGMWVFLRTWSEVPLLGSGEKVPACPCHRDSCPGNAKAGPHAPSATPADSKAAPLPRAELQPAAWSREPGGPGVARPWDAVLCLRRGSRWKASFLASLRVLRRVPLSLAVPGAHGVGSPPTVGNVGPSVPPQGPSQKGQRHAWAAGQSSARGAPPRGVSPTEQRKQQEKSFQQKGLSSRSGGRRVRSGNLKASRQVQKC